MTTISTVEQLMELEPAPCGQMLAWLNESGITYLADAWDRCKRGDWMLWLDDALDLLSDHERRMIVCRCVRETPLADGRTVWDLLEDDRSRAAVEVAERYARGDATYEQLAAAADSARDAARAAADARDAAEAAARAARTAADAAAAVRPTPWNGAEAAAAAAAAAVDAARADAMRADAAAAAAAAAEAAALADAAAAAEAAAYAARTYTLDVYASAAVYAARTYASDAAYATQADLIREIAGNPWRGKEA